MMARMIIDKIFGLICFAIVLNLSATFLSAQEKSQSVVMPIASIKTADGYLFVYNTPFRSFTIELKGKEVTPAKDTQIPMFFVDGRLVQIITVDIQHFVASNKPDANEEDTLEAHKIWESDYLATQYGEKLKLESEKLVLNNIKTLFWGFKRPSANESFDRDYFLSTVFGTKVLALSSPIKPSEFVAEYRSLLTGIMSTIKISSQPFDILKISEDLKKGK
jgi:hypothetical protein